MVPQDRALCSRIENFSTEAGFPFQTVELYIQHKWSTTNSRAQEQTRTDFAVQWRFLHLRGRKKQVAVFFYSAPKQIPIWKLEISYYTSDVPSHQRKGDVTDQFNQDTCWVTTTAGEAEAVLLGSPSSLQEHTSGITPPKWCISLWQNKGQENTKLQTSLCAALWVGATTLPCCH